ncbi:MAG: class I SAM-dependent methyltransferase [Armatimonadetes bacterium]|nr:class I SAM-dependent methyltransferase [Armatimonadota bacterium]
MSRRTLTLTDELYDYMLSISLREPEVMKRLREETARLPQSRMQIAPEQAQFMAFLAELIGARRVLEVGTFTGYSALALAGALPPEGRLITCDVNDVWTSMARPFWEEAGVLGRIEVRLGPAVGTLDALLDEGLEGTFDLAFIDADKENYRRYYEQCLRLVRSGGLVLLDNILWSGRVADSRVKDVDTEALRQINRRLHQDERVSLSVLPLADGLTIALKR